MRAATKNHRARKCPPFGFHLVPPPLRSVSESEEDGVSPHHSAEFSGGQFVPVLLQVTKKDIERMDYFFNDAPMADISRHNAVAFALSRVTRSPKGVSVSFSPDHVQARIGGRSVALNAEIAGWLETAMKGLEVRPSVWLIWLPPELVEFEENSEEKASSVEVERTRIPDHRDFSI